MASVEVSVVGLGDLIAGPIIATVQADFSAAIQFVDYLKKYGFQRNASEPLNNLGKLKMAQFTFPQADHNGVVRERVMRLPELSLIPLPLLQVDRADYRFGVRVLVGERHTKDSQQLALVPEEDESVAPERYHWKAIYSPTRPSPPTETRPDVHPYIDANIEATVAVRQADIPAGISRLLALLGSEAEILTGTLNFSPARISLVPGERSIEISLQALRADQSPAGDVAIHLEHSPAEKITVYHGTQVWTQGEKRTTDGAGRLTFAVRVAQSATPGETIPLTFSSHIEGGYTSATYLVRVGEVAGDTEAK